MAKSRKTMDIIPEINEGALRKLKTPQPCACALKANPVAVTGKRYRPTSELRKVIERFVNHRAGFDERRVLRGATTSHAAISRNIPKKAVSLIKDCWSRVNMFMGAHYPIDILSVGVWRLHTSLLGRTLYPLRITRTTSPTGDIIHACSAPRLTGVATAGT
jgi:hypothetical protein